MSELSEALNVSQNFANNLAKSLGPKEEAKTFIIKPEYKTSAHGTHLTGSNINLALCGADVANKEAFVSELGIQHAPSDSKICHGCTDELIKLKKMVANA